ncbi:MAG: DUF4118 domain-containing protein [Sphingomonas bacterium]
MAENDLLVEATPTGVALVDHIVVAVSGAPGSDALVRSACQLADALGAAWEAIHIETPEAGREDAEGLAAAEALGLAARLGATIANIPAATVFDGIAAHLAHAPAAHLVIGASAAPARYALRSASLLDALAAGPAGLVLHVYPRAQGPAKSVGADRTRTLAIQVPLRFYAYAAGSVAATLLAAELLQLFISTRSLDLLFLFPVIAVAARLGLRPALLAVALSVVSYNYFLLAPAFSFDPTAPQNLVMTGVLIAVAAYTSGVTTRMRGRLLLSDRSARENASLAALAQKLTRDSDWETTAHTICEHVHALLGVQTIVYREVEGHLCVAGAISPGVGLGPIDHAALDWVWANGGEAGSGTAMLSTANWQFQALKTSLGVLAVLGLAREDGRDPIRADQRILLHTLVAQAALAHERLRLEDLHRERDGAAPESTSAD